MFHYLVLCLLAACIIPPGQSQSTVPKECYNCRLRVNNICRFTSTPYTVCPNDNFCGTVRYNIGTDNIFSTTGCLTTADCNTTGSLSGVAKMFTFNATCCNSNYCNGGFMVQAPHVAMLASLGIFAFYVIS